MHNYSEFTSLVLPDGVSEFSGRRYVFDPDEALRTNHFAWLNERELPIPTLSAGLTPYPSDRVGFISADGPRVTA